MEYRILKECGFAKISTFALYKLIGLNLSTQKIAPHSIRNNTIALGRFC